MLNPYQLGKLALYVHDCIKTYQLDVVSQIPEMDPWEAALKVYVDRDPDLPTYEEIQKSDTVILETIIEYYSE